MDLSDATKILLGRITKFETLQIAKNIIGFLLLQDHGEREMIRLAYAPEKLLENFVNRTKVQLEYLSKNPPSSSMADLSYGSGPYSSPSLFGFSVPNYWDPQLPPEQQAVLSSEFASMYGDSGVEDFRIQNQAQFVGFEDPLDHLGAGAGGYSRGDIYYQSRRSPSLSDFPIKTCHYFNKGFCKHGSSCRYLHGPDNMSSINFTEYGGDDHMFSPVSLEKLELEITELLKLRRGSPVSIASLPMLYLEKYGKNIQAEGYLTESQRHGRAGYSLTKLLARLKSIRLIDRPHGQHSVILAEDAPKYNLENRNERNDPGPIVSGSRQIYLTFPAESGFSEDDVSNYFSTFGPVEDVRIPCQQKRMFGFVTFASANTVQTVLAKGNPHFVCGSRVLVKPYREKSKLVERKYMEKNDHGMYYPGNYLDLEPDFHPLPRCEPPRLLRRHREEQEAKSREMRTRFSELYLGYLGRKRIHNRQYLDYDELHASEDEINYLLSFINNTSISDNRSEHPGTDFIDQESQGINLPESPFAPAIGSDISPIM